MTEDTKEEDVQKYNYYYSVIHMKNGDVLVGPATIHTPVRGSTSIEDWIYTEFVVMSYPIRMNIEQLPDRYLIGFGKYANFTNSSFVFLERKSIQSVNYASAKTKEFYVQAKEYLQRNIDTAIDKELDNYIKILKQKNNVSEMMMNKEKMTAKELFEFIMSSENANSNITIH